MSQSELEKAHEILINGGVVAIPTETVYGLAAGIHKRIGIEKIFQVKKRPFFDPLIVHVSSKQMAARLTTDWSPMADFLAEHFWPGPLTLVLPKTDAVDSMITSGLETVGIRMPRNSQTLSLIEKLDIPLAAPSANRFGRTSPTTAEHVRSEFPDEDLLILDGGPCDIGLESTVLLMKRTDNRYRLSILRAGGITRKQLEKALKNRPFEAEFVDVVSAKESPGHMKHHYMPETPLIFVKKKALTTSEILNKVKARIHQLPEQVEGVQIRKPTRLEVIRELQLPEDPGLAARQLYQKLRDLSSDGADVFFFRQTELHLREEWQAVIDRLTKASSIVLE